MNVLLYLCVTLIWLGALYLIYHIQTWEIYYRTCQTAIRPFVWRAGCLISLFVSYSVTHALLGTYNGGIICLGGTVLLLTGWIVSTLRFTRSI